VIKMMNGDKYEHTGRMTVGQLKKVLGEYNDNAKVIISACNSNMLGNDRFPEHVIGHTESDRKGYLVLVTTIR